ncbi:hypothetical protein, partial [uncultured Arthrobacter sp.]|uniref:hypothetical protein n=1 Tax=uncultured Arthrobacter sp. TaxID=114050 RepID=UPI0032163C02
MDNSAFQTSPLDGMTKAAAAEMPNATEPATLITPIFHVRGRGRPAMMPRPAYRNATALDTRKATEPRASGRHTRCSVSAAQKGTQGGNQYTKASVVTNMKNGKMK